jgi:hypothetical protein
MDRFGHQIEDIQDIKNTLVRISTRQDATDRNIAEMNESKVGKEYLTDIYSFIEDFKSRQNEFKEQMEAFIEEQRVREERLSKDVVELSARIESMDKIMIDRKKKGKKGSSIDEEEKDRSVTFEMKGDISENEHKILSIVPPKGYTLHRIKKEMGEGIDGDTVEKCLQSLIDKGYMSTILRGRHTIYLMNQEKEENKKPEVKDNA